jgi:large subunit ribosomal protein L6
MSRIGKLPIKIPNQVQITVSDNNIVTVKGPMGELKQTVDPCITVKVNDSIVSLERHTEQKKDKSLHGLYRSLIYNMVTGVSKGYKIEQEVIGVGYKINSHDQILELSIGNSYSIVFELPKEVKVETITQRGKTARIILSSVDKQLIGQVAAKIRSLKKPEPYKGKGIKFLNEQIRRKAGKTAGD